MLTPSDGILRQFGRGMHGICLAAVAGLGLALAEETPSASPLTVTEYERLYGTLQLKGGVWDIPWKVSVTEARRESLRQGKPIFMVVNTGNCLGFV